jgi:hypothetical protein|nr:MAG TPA: hypothetical protein [Caudoviricetes sp.]
MISKRNIIITAPRNGGNMVIIYRYIYNPKIYAIYRRKSKTLIVSTNPKAIKGVIFVEI